MMKTLFNDYCLCCLKSGKENELWIGRRDYLHCCFCLAPKFEDNRITNSARHQAIRMTTKLQLPSYRAKIARYANEIVPLPAKNRLKSKRRPSVYELPKAAA